MNNNTVFLSSPKDFDDPYDSNIYIDSNEFALQRIRYYADLCGVRVESEWDYETVSLHLAKKIYNHVIAEKSLNGLFKNRDDSELIHMTVEEFLLLLQIELGSTKANGDSYYIAFNKVIKAEYEEIQKTANRFRISCFAETPYSMLMWSHYANNHHGFCIEYETPEYSSKNVEIYQNLFPVIYTDKRIDLTKLSLN